MIDATLCSEQILRLSGLRGYPQEPAAIKELVYAIEGNATSERHAVTAMDAWLEGNTRCPTPYELRHMLNSTAPEPQIKQRCKACGNSGYVSALWLVTWDRCGNKTRERITTDRAKQIASADTLKIDVQMIYEGVEACACDLALRIQAGQREKSTGLFA